MRTRRREGKGRKNPARKLPANLARRPLPNPARSPTINLPGDLADGAVAGAGAAEGASVDQRPIGMFDSGVGGLTVLHECLVSHPNEDFIYLGDTGRFPYGPRRVEEISSFAWQIASHLLSLDVKLLVVACNSATAAALPWLQEQLEASIIGAVHPEAEAAVQTTRNRRIGILATEATV